MNDTAKKIAGATGSLLLLSSMGMGAVTAFAEEAPEAAPAGAEAVEGEGGAAATSPVVAGTFSFTQDTVSSIDQVARMLRASSYLCGGAGGELTEVAAADWEIAVRGDVESPYVTTVADIQADPAVQKVLLGCSCAGNPADGDASVAAQVTGVSVKLMLDRAGVAEGANTVVFTSADGYEVALPLRYLTQRYCPIVFDVNGSPIADAAGGTNQLWLGSTSAKYFVRNVASITVESRDQAPADPGSPESGDTYANLPNVGVDFGGEIA